MRIVLICGDQTLYSICLQQRGLREHTFPEQCSVHVRVRAPNCLIPSPREEIGLHLAEMCVRHVGDGLLKGY
jgi:hypothetical protein